jgi:uncharacterized protein (TIGR01777 family)
MRIALTGASGLIGSALASTLAGLGHEVTRLVRHDPAGPGDVVWQPDRGIIDAAGLDGIDAVVHLAGEPIGVRWNEARKQRILTSRVDGTQLLASTVARLTPQPALICASAIGIYGNRGDEILTEDAVRGTGFLSDVVAAWEDAAEPARAAGARVVHLRTGVVLTAHGGALGRMLLPFRLGLGGRVGSGRQWLSWVSLEDTIAGYVHAITSDLTGTFNLTGPNPVTNVEFVRALGRALHRPTIMPLPAFAVRFGFGQMGRETLLEGQRVLPARLLRAGFVFERPTIAEALAAALAP